MNLILLESAGQLFGVAADRVVQVVEPPPATPIPFLPDHVEGLVNIGGAVIISMDLARSLGKAETGASRVSMVVRGAQGAFALTVGRVLMMVPVEPAELHPLEHGNGGPATEAVVAAEFSWRDRMVLVIDPDRFDLGEFLTEGAAGEVPALAAEIGAGRTATDEPRRAAKLPWLVVELERERYALDLGAVTEVVEADQFLPVPKAPEEVVGYYALRGVPLLVVALSKLLDVPPSPVRHVVVVEHGGGVLGLGVARVAGIRSLDAENGEEVGDATGAVASCLSDADGSLLAVLDLDHVLTPEVMARLSDYMPRREAAAEAVGHAERETHRLLTFWVGDELCGVDLETVSRVAEYQPWSELPDDRGLGLAGISQIGNEVMPVIDLRERRRRKPAQPPLAQVVARVDGSACALAVDRMHRIIDVPADDIHDLDDAGEGELVRAVGQADGHLISILALDHLMGGRAPC